MYSFEVYSCVDSSKVIGNYPKVLNFNRFICQFSPIIALQPRYDLGRKLVVCKCISCNTKGQTWRDVGANVVLLLCDAMIGCISRGRAMILTWGSDLIIWKYPIYNLFSNVNRWSNLIIYWEIWTHRANIPIIFFDNVANVESFGKGLFSIDDHKIDHPIITNKHCQ